MKVPKLKKITLYTTILFERGMIIPMDLYPKISIITPTYNSEEFLEQTIRSVIDQTYRNVEYIIIDGESTDETISIINKYHNHVAKFISEKDRGSCDAVNKGIRLATGDVILFLGSDDYLYNKKILEEVSEFFRRDRNLSMVYGKAMFQDVVTGYSTINGRKTSLHDLEEWRMSPFPGFFIKRDLYLQFGLLDFNYKFAYDFDLLIKCFKSYEDQSLFIDRIISVFRMGGMSTLKRNRDEIAKEVNQIIDKHFGHPLEKMEHALSPTYCLKLWIEQLIFANNPISKQLNDQGIRKISIFGTDKLAILLAEDARRAGIHVVSLLDNHTEKHGYRIKGVEIHSPKWLTDHADQIDAVIVSIEGNHDVVIVEQLNKLLPKKSELKIMTWKKVLEDQFEWLF